MDGEENCSEETDSLAQAEDITTGGVKLENNPEMEAEVSQVEHRGGEANQRHCEPARTICMFRGWLNEYLNTTHPVHSSLKGSKVLTNIYCTVG